MQHSPMAAFPASLACAFDIGLNDTFPAAITAWREYAATKYPEEAVGVIGQDGKFYPLDNVHPEPTKRFDTDPSVYADLVKGVGIAGIVHSHTPQVSKEENGVPMPVIVQPTPEPSAADMSGQIATAVPWGISNCYDGGCSHPLWWGDQLPVRPLIGRPFAHGIADCFTIIRDWHRLNGITFQDFPRDDRWWQPEVDEEGNVTKPAGNLYEEGFAEAGFVRQDRQYPDLKVGDVFLCQFRASVINHGGVVLAGGLILHHPAGHLSVRAPANLYKTKMGFLVRHKDLPDDVEDKAC